MLVKVAMAIGALIVFGACMPSSEPTGDVGDGAASGPAMEVVAIDNRFIPDDLSVPAGEKVTVEVTNEGDTPHEFAVADLDLSTGTIRSGETAHATFVVPTGVTSFVCTYHDGMRGQIESRS